MLNKKLILLLIIFLLSSPSLVLAQNMVDPVNTKIDIGDVLKETENKPEMETENSPLPELEPEKIKEPASDLGAEKILVEKIIISGNDFLSTAELEKLVNTETYIGQKISFLKMQTAALAVTKYYRQQGFFVARAYIPQQKMKNNILEIAVIEGRYGDFILKNDSLVKAKKLQAILDAVKAQNIISVDTIERAMLIINDRPGAVVVQSDVMPGAAVGTSDFMIKVNPTARFSGYLVADNYGSEYTGEDRLTGALNINSPFALGDQIGIQAMLSDGSGIENYRLAYSLPLNARGLEAELAYARTEYELGDIYSALEIEGVSKDSSLSFSYPIKRTRLHNIKLRAELMNRDLEDEQAGIKTAAKTLNKLTLDLTNTKNYRLKNWNSKRTIKAGLSVGDLDRSPDNSAFEDTAGAFTKTNFHFAENIKFNSKWSLNNSLKIQYVFSEQNLDGSEDFSVGGVNGVRLYPASEHSAEKGYLVNLELFYNLPDLENYSHRLGLFYDLGSVDMADPVANFESRTLQDLGLAYHLNYKDFFAKLNWAHKIGNEDVTAESDYDSRFLVQAGFGF